MSPAPLDLSLARRIAGLQPSATFAMIARVRDLQRQGREILDLTAGEPDFHPPKCAEEAGIRAIQEGRGRYTPASGTLELRAEAAAWARGWGLDWSAEEIVVTSGAKIALSQALLALVDPGRKVLIPVPCWTSYPEMVRIAEAVPVPVPCDSGFLPRVEDLETAWDPDCAALLLNTPGNPTGAVIPEERLEAIADWALEKGLWVLSDEIYASLTYDPACPHVSPFALRPALRERGVWVNGMSKAFAMTGWRIGFLGAPAPLARAIGGLQSQLASCPNAISQIAALAALRHGGEDCARMLEVFARRARLVSSRLRQMPELDCPEPRGAFYAFPRLRPEVLERADPRSGEPVGSGDRFAEMLLEQEGVACIGGGAFGDARAFRLSFATSEEVLDQALERIRALLASLR